jgi:hypothetical protein
VLLLIDKLHRDYPAEGFDQHQAVYDHEVIKNTLPSVHRIRDRKQKHKWDKQDTYRQRSQVPVVRKSQQRNDTDSGPMVSE